MSDIGSCSGLTATQDDERVPEDIPESVVGAFHPMLDVVIGHPLKPTVPSGVPRGSASGHCGEGTPPPVTTTMPTIPPVLYLNSDPLPNLITYDHHTQGNHHHVPSSFYSIVQSVLVNILLSSTLSNQLIHFISSFFNANEFSLPLS